jgi:hypothetical protein
MKSSADEASVWTSLSGELTSGALAVAACRSAQEKRL